MRQLIALALLLWLGSGGQARGAADSKRGAKNVLLFTVDSCRPDRFSLYGNARKTTPNIDSWAKGAVVYDNAFSVSSWTAPGLVSILTGLYPWQHGVDSRDRMLRPLTQTLPKMFRQAGYAVPNLNFFTFVSYYQGLGLGEIEREYFTDKDGDELLKWLDRNGQQRFFAWYHTTTVHQPYNPSGGGTSAEDSEGIAAVKRGAIVPKGSVKFVPSDRPVLLDLYDAEIEKMDRFFGSVLAKLREKNLLDSTVIVFSADHGEELLEHGFVGHASTSLEAHVHDEVIRIPLIISAPGQLRAERRSELIQQVDLYPRILWLAGLGKRPPDKPRRQVLVESVIAGNQTTREREGIWVRALRTTERKYVERWENGKRVAGGYYDLRSDPGEKNLLQGSARFPTPAPGSRIAAAVPSSAKGKGRQACPVIAKPQPGQTVDYVPHTGAILFEWDGAPGDNYVVEYDIGIGDHHVAGKYPVKGNYQILGPFPRELWRSLKAWNPFRIRVSRAGEECWSEWREFFF